MLSPLPIRRARILAVISSHFYIPDKRKETILESLEVFQKMPSPSPLAFSGKKFSGPMGGSCLSLPICCFLWEHLHQANGVLPERERFREGHHCCHKHLMGHKHAPGCVNHQCHSYTHAFPRDVQSWPRSDCSRPVQECFLSMWQMLPLVTAS